MSSLITARTGLKRALLLSTLALAALSALAFWPSKRWAPPPRPGLERPIVLDTMAPPAAPPAESSAAPATP